MIWGQKPKSSSKIDCSWVGMAMYYAKFHTHIIWLSLMIRLLSPYHSFVLIFYEVRFLQRDFVYKA